MGKGFPPSRPFSLERRGSTKATGGIVLPTATTPRRKSVWTAHFRRDFAAKALQRRASLPDVEGGVFAARKECADFRRLTEFSRHLGWRKFFTAGETPAATQSARLAAQEEGNRRRRKRE